MANCRKRKNDEKLAIDSLRHAEYYNMQKTFDKLYAASKENKTFDNLMNLILSEENIILAYRNIDCQGIAFKVNRTLENRLRSRGRGARLGRTGRELTSTEKEKYGKSKQLRFEKGTGSPIFPIGYVQTRKPMNRKYGQTPYTEEGRALIHNRLEGINVSLMHALMNQKVYQSVEYADNRISLFTAQQGTCAITGIEFKELSEIHCHHKTPRSLGGSDAYDNLTLILDSIHKLIHATNEDTIKEYLHSLKLTKAQIEQINQYRKLAKLNPIPHNKSQK